MTSNFFLRVNSSYFTKYFLATFIYPLEILLSKIFVGDVFSDNVLSQRNLRVARAATRGCLILY